MLAQVDETDLGKISLGQPVEIRVDAYSDQVVTGKVIRIAYESKQVNNVTIYEIRILPDEVPSFMRSGMTTSVKFIQDMKMAVLVAPVSFLKPVKLENNGSSGVNGLIKPSSQVLALVKPSDPKLDPEERTVSIGVTNGKSAEVLSGLEEGMTILQPETTNNAPDKASNPFIPMGPSKGKKK